MLSRRLASVAAAALTLAVVSPALSVLNAAPAQAATKSASGGSTSPAYAKDFPDPAVLAVGTIYYAYSTGSAGRNLQVMSSPDMQNWTAPVDPLPVLPTWASGGNTWAPAVMQSGPGFVMYYTVRDSALGRQCISVASSSTAIGPFTDGSSGPLVCDTNGSIDPSVLAAGSSLYLVWKSDDNSVGLPTRLWSRPLAPGGMAMSPGTSPALLLTASASWQASVIEGPSMVAVPKSSKFDLFYGANAWDSTSAGIGYAVCAGPSGPCTNQSTLRPWMRTNSAINKNGPAGPGVFVDASGRTRLAYHAWGQNVGYPQGQRMLWIDSLSFSGSTPSIP